MFNKMQIPSVNGGVENLPFTPNSNIIQSNTITVEKGNKVYVSGEALTKVTTNPGDTLISGLPKPSASVDILYAIYRKDSTTVTRKLTVDMSGNLKLASGESTFTYGVTWVFQVIYTV